MCALYFSECGCLSQRTSVPARAGLLRRHAAAARREGPYWHGGPVEGEVRAPSDRWTHLRRCI
jgi:hypothetical protein